MKVYVFIACCVMHIIADFVCQGKMGELKQRDWWIENYPQYMGENGVCRYDYMVALFMHSFLWSVAILLPIGIYYNFETIEPAKFVIVLLLDTALHMAIDNLKANVKILNLVCDQMFHLIQIVMTFSLFW